MSVLHEADMLADDEQSEDLSDPAFGPHKPHMHYCMVCDFFWQHDGADCDMPKSSACPMHDESAR